MDRLKAGLNGEDMGVCRMAQLVCISLARSIHATELLSLPKDVMVAILKVYFNPARTHACLVITPTHLVLQTGQHVPVQIAITPDNRHQMALIVNTCCNMADELGLPCNVFDALSENRSLVPRMLARPAARNKKAGFFKERQQQVEQHQQRRHQYSLVKPTIRVSPDAWVVSLMRKKTGKNPEHAFIIIEGRTTFGLGVLHKLELVIDNARTTQRLPVVGITLGFGKVEITSRGDIPLDDLATVFHGEDFLRDASFYAKSWPIDSFQSEQLLKWAREEQAREGTDEQVKYFLAGDQSKLASLSPKSGASRRRHNCFTWAAELLELLEKEAPEEDRIIKIERNAKLYARTSDYLRDPHESKKYCLMM